MAISEDLQLMAQCPDWTLVVSGVFQVSILGPRLLNIFISDIGSGVKYMLRKPADSNKLSGTVSMFEGKDAMQKDLNSLEK